MRTVRKSRKSLLISLLGILAGLAGIIAFIVIIEVYSSPGVPLAEGHPGLAMLVQLLVPFMILPLIYGLMSLGFSAVYSRGKRVFIDGKMLGGIKVFESKYKSSAVEELIEEVKGKLAGRSFFEVNGFAGAYCRNDIAGTKTFYFSTLSEFTESSDGLIARINQIGKAVSQSSGKARIKENSLVLFLPLNEVSNEQLFWINDFKQRLLAQAEVICDICLYSLAEKRAYITFTSMKIQGQPLTIEKGGKVFCDVCAGLKPSGRTVRRSATPFIYNPVGSAVSATADQSVAANHSVDAQTVLAPQETLRLKVRNLKFVFSCFFGVLFLGVFVLLLVLWLPLRFLNAITFFCLFIPLFLLPGLALVYFALAAYKRIEIGRGGAKIIRPLGSITVFENALAYAEKKLPGNPAIGALGRRVFILYPASDRVDGDVVFSVNNYKKYIIVDYCEHNKNLLEKNSRSSGFYS